MEMIKKATHVPIFVKDQDEALSFYIKIGFKKHIDKVLPDGCRWLTISIPGQKDFEFALIKAVDEEQMDLVGNQAAFIPLFYLLVDDIDKTVQYFKRHSAEIVHDPIDKPWGREARFADLYGNIFAVYSL